MSKKFKGRRVTPSAMSRADLLPASVNWPFLFQHHPTSWEFKVTDAKPEGEWLPVLAEFLCQPGLNGCRRRGKNGVDFTMAVAMREAQGWITIRDTHIDGGYMQEYDVPGGRHYTSIWADPQVIGAGSGAVVKWSFDHASFDAFRASLVTRGIVAPPAEPVLDKFRRIQRKRTERLAPKGHIPHVARQILLEEAKLTAMAPPRRTSAKVRGNPSPVDVPA